MENEEIKKCEHCGKEFTPLRADAKYCSDACRKAAYKVGSKLNNLTWNGIVIRGQHVGDVPPTDKGIIIEKCRHCRQPFSRWMDAKLARLVRNEVEGSINWGSAEEFKPLTAKFNHLLAKRKEEVKFCSDECQKKGALSWSEVLKMQLREREKQNGAQEVKEQPRARGPQ